MSRGLRHGLNLNYGTQRLRILSRTWNRCSSSIMKNLGNYIFWSDNSEISNDKWGISSNRSHITSILTRYLFTFILSRPPSVCKFWSSVNSSKLLFLINSYEPRIASYQIWLVKRPWKCHLRAYSLKLLQRTCVRYFCVLKKSIYHHYIWTYEHPITRIELILRIHSLKSLPEICARGFYVKKINRPRFETVHFTSREQHVTPRTPSLKP